MIAGVYYNIQTGKFLNSKPGIRQLQKGFFKRGQALFLASFAGLILLGALLLKVPGAYRAGVLSWVDSLFMATSAVCVTGLAVVSPGDFSWFGQMVLLLMMQCGGIGIMTLSASILLLLGRGLSFSDSLMVSNLNDKFSLRGSESLTRTVIDYTLVCELIGFVFILPGCLLKGNGNIFSRIWEAVFISVSSFCNAGLTLASDSLVSAHWLTRTGSAILIVLGGLGVYVIYDLFQVIRKRQKKLRVHSKVVLVTTALLILCGAVFFRLLGTDDGGVLPWRTSFFFAITARTAGFTTFDVSALPSVSLALLMVLMMIGGSPGSTAGGIKTSTFAVAAAAIFNTLQGNQQTLLFKRSIPQNNVMRAFTIIILFSLLAGAGILLLQLLTPNVEITDNAFEAVSALCTTGLSIGNTTRSQSEAGRLLLTLLMFLGRVGPFTFMLFLLGREKPGRLKYPEERVIIG